MTVVRAYARISVFSEVSQQIDQARHLIGKWAAFKHPDAEVVWYTDEGVSGALPMSKRPAGRRLLRELGKGDVLVTTKLDRLARNLTDLLDTLRRVDEVGASFTATEQDVTTTGPYGRFSLVLLGAVAELERSIMAERQRAAREQLHRDGRHVGTLHYGLTTVPHPSGKGLAVRPHPEEGPMLRAAVEAVLAGASMASQARRLGISRPGIQRLLRSERLIGRTPGNGPAVDEDARLISTAQWQQLRRMLDRDEPRVTTRTEGYGAAVACWECGGRMYLDVNSREGKGSYRCHGEGCESRVSIARELVDQAIESLFAPGTPDGDRRVIEHRMIEDDQEHAERLAVVELALEDTTSAMRADGADVAALAARVAELHLERSRIAAETRETRMVEIDTGKVGHEHWSELDYAGRVVMLRFAYGVAVWPGKGWNRRNPRVEVVERYADSKRWRAITHKLPDPFGGI